MDTSAAATLAREWVFFPVEPTVWRPWLRLNSGREKYKSEIRNPNSEIGAIASVSGDFEKEIWKKLQIPTKNRPTRLAGVRPTIYPSRLAARGNEKIFQPRS